MQRLRQIAAYGVCHDGAGAVLLATSVDPDLTNSLPGEPGLGAQRARWTLPGERVAHGENPADTVVRAFADRLGLPVRVIRVRDVAADLTGDLHRARHTDAVVYDLALAVPESPVPEFAVPESPVLESPVSGTPSPEGTRWVAAGALGLYPLSALAASTFGLSAPEPPRHSMTGGCEPKEPVPKSQAGPQSGSQTGSQTGSQPRPAGRRGQRFAVYGVVTDPADRVLLTLNAEGYPGAGHWHLPGGGTDFGEQPVDGLLREIVEETAQVGTVSQLLSVTHRYTFQEGRPEEGDWHAVRAIYRVAVPDPTVPKVLDLGGSTAEAGWFNRAALPDLPLTDLAAAVFEVRT